MLAAFIRGYGVWVLLGKEWMSVCVRNIGICLNLCRHCNRCFESMLFLIRGGALCHLKGVDESW